MPSSSFTLQNLRNAESELLMFVVVERWETGCEDSNANDASTSQVWATDRDPGTGRPEARPNSEFELPDIELDNDNLKQFNKA